MSNGYKAVEEMCDACVVQFSAYNLEIVLGCVPRLKDRVRVNFKMIGETLVSQ